MSPKQRSYHVEADRAVQLWRRGHAAASPHCFRLAKGSSTFLDHKMYPHIMDEILGHSRRDELVVFRSTCKTLLDRADRYLMRHLIVGTEDFGIKKYIRLDMADVNDPHSGRCGLPAAYSFHARRHLTPAAGAIDVHQPNIMRLKSSSTSTKYLDLYTGVNSKNTVPAWLQRHHYDVIRHTRVSKRHSDLSHWFARAHVFIACPAELAYASMLMRKPEKKKKKKKPHRLPILHGGRFVLQFRPEMLPLPWGNMWHLGYHGNVEVVFLFVRSSAWSNSTYEINQYDGRPRLLRFLTETVGAAIRTRWPRDPHRRQTYTFVNLEGWLGAPLDVLDLRSMAQEAIDSMGAFTPGDHELSLPEALLGINIQSLEEYEWRVGEAQLEMEMERLCVVQPGQ